MGLPALVSRENPGTFGPYELVEQLGQGGMAVVYRARQRGAAGFSRDVVLKAMLPALVKSKPLVEMFETEARLTAQLRHPNIVQVEDYGVAGGIPYLIMELLDGKNLSQLRNALNKQRRRVPIGAAVTIARDLCLALGYAHHFVDHEGKRMQIIHRDISPSNVMVLRDGSIRLLDFGVAKLSVEQGQAVTTSLKGKFAYMAPEQVNQEPIDRRCDVFAAGIVLHELLTGKRLFGTRSELETLRRVSAAEAKPPSTINPEVPPALDAIVMKALSKRREERYDSGTEMAAALEGLRLSLARREVAGLIEEIFPAAPSEGIDTHAFVDPAELEDTENGAGFGGDMLGGDMFDGVTSPDKGISAPHLVLMPGDSAIVDDLSISRTGRDLEIEALPSGSFDRPALRSLPAVTSGPTNVDKAFPSEPTRAAPLDEIRPTRIYDPTKAPEREAEPPKPRTTGNEFDAQPTSVYVSDELLQTPPLRKKTAVEAPRERTPTPPVVISPSLSVSLSPAATTRTTEKPAPVLTGSVLVEDREQSAPPPMEPQSTRIVSGSMDARSFESEPPPTTMAAPDLRKKSRAWLFLAGGLIGTVAVVAILLVRDARRIAIPVEAAPPATSAELASPTLPDPKLPAEIPAATPPSAKPAVVTPPPKGGISLVDLDRKPDHKPESKPVRTPKATATPVVSDRPKSSNPKRTPAISRPKSAPKGTVKDGRIVDPFEDGG